MLDKFAPSLLQMPISKCSLHFSPSYIPLYYVRPQDQDADYFYALVDAGPMLSSPSG